MRLIVALNNPESLTDCADRVAWVASQLRDMAAAGCNLGDGVENVNALLMSRPTFVELRGEGKAGVFLCGNHRHEV
jgi:hypothetical protein